MEEYSWLESGTYTSPSGDVYVLPNNKQFTTWVQEKYGKYTLTDELLGSCEDTGGDEKPLFLYQQFIREYMSMETPFRGVLAYHGLGSGKTRTAIASAEPYRAAGVKILVLLPATLKPTWYNELKTWGNEDIRRPPNYNDLDTDTRRAIDKELDAKIDASYDFVSYNASNTLAQLKKATGNQIEHRFVIVDEIHNLVSMMVNPQSKKGYNLYHSLMNAVDTKFIFLSATPLLNFPFELGIMFNILRGYMYYKGQKYTLFPENEVEFEEYFVDYDTQKIRNPELFKKRILGLVSYYYGAKGDVYPDLIVHPPTEIEFSDYQFKKYAEVRTSELERESKAKKPYKQKLANLSGAKSTSSYSSQKDKVSSTFRIFSRQFSNYVFPEKIKRPFPNDYSSLVKIDLPANPDHWTGEQVDELMKLFDGDAAQFEEFAASYSVLETNKARIKFIKETISQKGKEAEEFCGITSEEEQFFYEKLSLPADYKEAIGAALMMLRSKLHIYFKELLDCLSRKMEAMLRNIMEGDGCDGPALVYSQFRTLEGVSIFGYVLEAAGFEPLPYDQINSSNIAEFKGKMRYVVYSGEEDNDVRDKILWIYNHPENKHGEIVKVFLGTSAAAEGISLKNTKQVHIMEPYWNEVRIRQVIGRARRICSHAGLPKSEQKVYVFRYHMVLTDKQKKKFPEEESTDEAIYRIAKTKENINDQFLQILKDAAVDCSFNASHNITTDNPIKCFAFDSTETGISFYPGIGSDKSDNLYLIHYSQNVVNYAVFNMYGPDNSTYYEDGDYKYVYKYVDTPKNVKKEKIHIAAKNLTVTAIVLYDKTLAMSGNMFTPKLAIVGKPVIPAKVFELVD